MDDREKYLDLAWLLTDALICMLIFFGGIVLTGRALTGVCGVVGYLAGRWLTSKLTKKSDEG